MTIAFDAATDLASGTGNRNIAHTPVGTPRGVLLLVANSDATSAVDSATYGGVAMTKIAGYNQAAGTEFGSVEVWLLGASIPTGAQTLAITSAGGETYIATCITITAAADVSFEDEIGATASSGGGGYTLTLTTTRESYVAGCIWTGTNAIGGILDGNGTNENQVDFGTDCAKLSSLHTPVAAGSPNLNWTGSTNSHHATVAVAVAEVAGAATFERSAALLATASVVAANRLVIRIRSASLAATASVVVPNRVVVKARTVAIDAVGSVVSAAVFFTVFERAAALSATADAAVVNRIVIKARAASVDAVGLVATDSELVFSRAAIVNAAANAHAEFVPYQVTGLVATFIGSSQIDLSWDQLIYQGSGYAYDVERSGVVIVRDHPTTSYSDTGLTPSTEYTYRVRAVR